MNDLLPVMFYIMCYLFNIMHCLLLVSIRMFYTWIDVETLLLFKTLDSAIVDLGNTMYRKTLEEDVSVAWSRFADAAKSSLLLFDVYFLPFSTCRPLSERPEESQDQYFRSRSSSSKSTCCNLHDVGLKHAALLFYSVP